MFDKELLSQALQASWMAETSYDPAEWTADNPARGQCVVTSLVVQDYLDGDIRRYRANIEGRNESHFCNVLIDGEYDLTKSQYPEGILLEQSPVYLRGYSSIREKLLSQVDARRKYLLLGSLVKGYIRTREIK